MEGRVTPRSASAVAARVQMGSNGSATLAFGDRTRAAMLAMSLR